MNIMRAVNTKNREVSMKNTTTKRYCNILKITRKNSSFRCIQSPNLKNWCVLKIIMMNSYIQNIDMRHFNFRSLNTQVPVISYKASNFFSNILVSMRYSVQFALKDCKRIKFCFNNKCTVLFKKSGEPKLKRKIMFTWGQFQINWI